MRYWYFAMKQQPSLTALLAFAAIARHGSFRAAADELNMSPSTLSHMMRALEERLGLRLFNRTTRSVAQTEAGDRLFRNLAPVLHDLDRALTNVGTLRLAVRTATHQCLRGSRPSSDDPDRPDFSGVLSRHPPRLGHGGGIRGYRCGGLRRRGPPGRGSAAGYGSRPVCW